MQIESIARVTELWEAAGRNFRDKQYPDDFPALPDMPAGRYIREDFFELEKKAVWSKSWLFSAIASELPNPGDFKRTTINDISVLIARGKDNKIRAFYNVCQHRGSMLVAEDKGNRSNFVCRYHCWSYDLEGSLKFVFNEHEFSGLDKSQKSLRAVRCESFGNLIFINFDEKAVSLNAYLGPIKDLLSDVPLDKVKLYKTLHYDVPNNWKALQDNFSENDHAKFVHGNTIDQLIDAKFTARQLLPNGHNAVVIKSRGNAEVGVNVFDRVSTLAEAGAAADGKLNEISRISQRNYNIFPNVTIPVSENLFPIVTVWPISVNRSRVDIYLMKITDAPQVEVNETDDGIVVFMDTFINEDLAALSGMQDALVSGGIKSMAIGWGEQAIYNHNLQVDRVIGRANIPPELLMVDVALPLAVRD